jgi:hypothetical protein
MCPDVGEPVTRRTPAAPTLVPMTAGLFGTGTHVLGVGHDRPDDRIRQADVHAVATPVVDGLELSVCGLLVTAVAAVAGQEWPAGPAVPRCAECSRIAG